MSFYGRHLYHGDIPGNEFFEYVEIGSLIGAVGCAAGFLGSFYGTGGSAFADGAWFETFKTFALFQTGDVMFSIYAVAAYLLALLSLVSLVLWFKNDCFYEVNHHSLIAIILGLGASAFIAIYGPVLLKMADVPLHYNILYMIVGGLGLLALIIETLARRHHE